VASNAAQNRVSGIGPRMRLLKPTQLKADDVHQHDRAFRTHLVVTSSIGDTE
jgi:hypothetical protein